jgi:rod shape-determining protein MreC
VVSIFTYRDERKLFALSGAIVVAAVLAVLQLDFVRSGRPSPLTLVVTSVTAWAQFAVAAVSSATHNGLAAVVQLPQLEHENAQLRARVAQLEARNRNLDETVARLPAEASLARAQLDDPSGIAATVIGYDPEDVQHVVTIDRGTKDGVHADDGVLTGDGAVGRVVEADPLSAKVLLLNDPQSRLPALVQRGRWWAIAVGTQTRVKLRYVSQDAKLRVGDAVVTGEGRSFHAGVLIGHITAVEPMAAGALDQTATVQPAVNLAAITRVLVVAK